MEMAEGYITRIALDENSEIIGYEFVHLGKMMEMVKKGTDANEALQKATGVQTQFDYYIGKLNIIREIAYFTGERAKVRCYGADDVREGVAIMHYEGVDVSITGNSTNPTRFQHPVAGTYKKECYEIGKKYFPSLPEAELGEHCIPTIWLRDRPLME